MGRVFGTECPVCIWGLYIRMKWTSKGTVGVPVTQKDWKNHFVYKNSKYEEWNTSLKGRRLWECIKLIDFGLNLPQQTWLWCGLRFSHLKYVSNHLPGSPTTFLETTNRKLTILPFVMCLGMLREQKIFWDLSIRLLQKLHSRFGNATETQYSRVDNYSKLNKTYTIMVRQFLVLLHLV